MELKNLHLYNFRNYSEQKIEFSSGINIFTGANGQGKTNILEAISLITQGHSFKSNKNTDLIKWGEKEFILRIETQDLQKDFSQSLKLNKQNQKVIKINNQESSRMADLFGKFPLVIMEPGDVNLVKGSPLFRRKFIDILICQHNPNYMNHLQKYRRVLQQKNAVLKKDYIDFNIVEVLNTHLAQLGAYIILSRHRNISLLNEKAQSVYDLICNGQESFKLIYHNKAIEQSQVLEEIIDILIAKMSRAFEAEKMRKSCLVGPHRDELLITIKDHSLRDFGSQGQARSAALALKLASTELLEQETGRKPILLLDDIFAELDQTRRLALQELALSSSQVFVTAPQLDGLNFSNYKHFLIKENNVDCIK